MATRVGIDDIEEIVRLLKAGEVEHAFALPARNRPCGQLSHVD
jgi:hypothetical protein